MRSRAVAPSRAADAVSRSLWFKLFSLLDPTEAARAAAVAPAPAPGTLSKRGSGAEEDFRDNDYQRRFIEQFCASTARMVAHGFRRPSHAPVFFPLSGWRKTTLCSRCFEPSTNAPIHAWKVRLCSPCIAASILNKSALAPVRGIYDACPLTPASSPRSRLKQDIHADAR